MTLEELIEVAVYCAPENAPDFVLERESAVEWAAYLGWYNQDFIPVLSGMGASPADAVSALLAAARQLQTD